MKGSIRAKGKCPNCGKSFSHVKRLGFICPECKTTPSRFYLDIFWKGERIRVFCDKTGQTLDTYQRALNLQATIQHEIENFTFDITKYSKAELQKYWTSTLLDRFLEAKLKTIAPSYVRHYKNMVNSHKEFFNTTDVREIKKINIINYLNTLNEKGFEGKTVKNYMDNFKTFLTWLKTDLEMLQIVPTFPTVEVKPYNWKWLSSEDQIRVLDLIDEADQPIIKFLMLHGSRPGEARALKVKHVDIKRQVITITSTFSDTVIRDRRKGRGAKPSIIPIHPEMLDYLRERCSNNLPEAFLFINPRSGKYYAKTCLNDVWVKARAKGNFPDNLRLYDATRHSLASQLVNQNITLNTVKEILGHSSGKTTERYAHQSIENLRAALDKVTTEVKKFPSPKTVTKPSPDSK
ncbi:MAG: tyrosine-type recombinase/integrase [Nitrospirae bacterium YQR-1]